jgi:hypothetical protein
MDGLEYNTIFDHIREGRLLIVLQFALYADTEVYLL